MLIEYEFENGKYKVIRSDEDYTTTLFRNGLYWEAGTNDAVGNKLFHAMLKEIDSLREYEFVYKELCE